MSLTLETGAIVPDADAFFSVADARVFATSRGVTLSAVDSEVEVLIRKGVDYLVSKEDRLKGHRVSELQTLPFPRRGVTVDNFPVSDTTIPATLKIALKMLVLEMVTTDALPAADGRVVLSEAVGPLSTTYADTGVQAPLPSFPKVDAYLSPLFKSAGLQTVRA